MSDDTRIVTCPAEGCDYDGPVNSVCAHYSGSKTDHPGGYEKAKSLLEQDTAPTQTQQSQDSSQQTKPQSTGTTERPFDSPDADPTGTGSGGGESGDMMELPCGHEEVDVAAAPTPCMVRCETCGDSWRLTDE